MVKKILVLVLIGSMVHAGGDGKQPSQDKPPTNSMSQHSSGPDSPYPVWERAMKVPCFSCPLFLAAFTYGCWRYNKHPNEFERPDPKRSGRFRLPPFKDE